MNKETDNIQELKLPGVPPPRYSPRHYREELFGIGTLLSLSAGLSITLVSTVFSEFYPEAYYGVVLGAGLIAASTPGILYFTGVALDSVRHH